MAVARRDAQRGDAPAPPRSLEPVLRFAHLPDRALATVRRAIDGDDAFRRRVVAQTRPEDLGDGGRLFLERPEGWQEALDILVGEAQASAEDARLRTRLQEAARATEALQVALEDARAQRDELAGQLARIRAELDHAQRDRTRVTEELGTVTASLAEMRAARAEAVRQLKDQEALATDRLRRQRGLEADLEALRATGPQVAQDPRLAEAATAAAGAAARADELAASLGALAGSLADPEVPSSSPAAPDARRAARPPDTAASPRPSRRHPVRLGRGLSADSTQGLAALLERSSTIILVDGYNVSMKAWPDQSVPDQRRSLVTLLASLKAGAAAEMHVVFDGAYRGARPAVRTPLPVRVHFTPDGIEADDRLLEFVEQAPAGSDVAVVSSDRRVRDGALERGANAVSAETLLALGRPR